MKTEGSKKKKSLFLSYVSEGGGNKGKIFLETVLPNPKEPDRKESKVIHFLLVNSE